MTGPFRNPFATEAAARRYATGRPDYSPRVRAIATRLLDADLRRRGGRFRRALDVACGTGISTEAIRRLATATVAIDVSPPMLAQVPRRPGMKRVLARAEQLPFCSAAFDLIGVGSAIHWLDQTAFSAELTRVAMPGARLLIHNHRWTAILSGDDEFREWMGSQYAVRYPPPERDRSHQPASDFGSWVHERLERYEHQLEMTCAQLIDYLITQSNIQTVIDAGDESESGVRTWLAHELSPFFADRSSGTFTMDGFVAVHRLAL